MQTPPGNSPERIKASLSFMLGLRQTERALALLPFAAFLQKLDTFKTLQDGTLAAYGTGCFEAGMLGHDLVFVKGSEKILDRVKERLGIDVGETTKDGKFSLEATRCVGACGLAPVFTVNDEVYGKATVKMIDEILDKYMEN